jgi:hypothetical protein
MNEVVDICMNTTMIIIISNQVERTISESIEKVSHQNARKKCAIFGEFNANSINRLNF